MPIPDGNAKDLIEFALLTLDLVPNKVLREQCQDVILQLVRDLQSGTIPEYPPPDFWRKRKFSDYEGPRIRTNIHASMLGINICHLCQHFGMYAFIHQGFAAALAKALNATFGPGAKYLELMAGAGWLAKGLAQEGLQGDYVAIDVNPWKGAIFPIVPMEAKEAILAYPDADCYLLSWPFYEDEAAAEAIRELPSGTPIVYIGEWGGNCGTASLFEQLDEIQELTSEQLRARKEFFTWYGHHDVVSFCLKR